MILDLQVVAAAAPGLDEIQVFQSTNGEGEPASSSDRLAATTLAAITQAPERRPTIISMSFGGCEASGSKLQQASLMEEVLLRAAATGISVFVSTGDQGVTSCRLTIKDQGLEISNAHSVVSAGYPATSPWVTAVGGTNLLLDADNAIVEEIVWNSWSPVELPTYGVEVIEIGAGTGGLSAWFAQPNWQRGIMFGEDLSFGSFEKARAVPDVSLLGDSEPGYAYLNGGFWGSVGGTSAASPLMAAGVAVMNQARQATDQPRMGFMNPLIYALGRDVRAQ
jgi:kumamolisin